MSGALILLGTLALGIFFSLVVVGLYVAARFVLPAWTAPFTLTACALVWAYVLL